MNSIYDIACSNLVLMDAESGASNYSMNYYFADQLEKLSKRIINFGTTMCETAANIRERTSKAQDNKANIQPVQFVEQVNDPTKKSEVTQNKRAAKIWKFKESLEFRAKREVMSTDKDTDSEPRDPDGHFYRPKNNENPPERHSFLCKFCEKVFRDRNNLRNDYSQHNMEFYTCVQCDHVFRFSVLWNPLSDTSHHTVNSTHVKFADSFSNLRQPYIITCQCTPKRCLAVLMRDVKKSLNIEGTNWNT